MALVNDGFFLYVTLIDNGANTSTLSYELTSADMTEAEADAATILAALAPLTLAAVKGYSISRRFVEDSLALPAQGIQVEQRAVVTAQLASSPLKRSQFVIPAPAGGIFVAAEGEGENTVDITDTQLRAYAALFGTGTGAVATISDGESIASEVGTTSGMIRGVRTHRRSSRG